MGTDSPDTHWTHGGQTVLPTWAVTFESTDTADVYQIAANWLHQLGPDAIDILCSSIGFTADGAATLTVCYQPCTPATEPVRSMSYRSAHNSGD
ncbi:MAG TPA: hypothetical protein VFX16_12670 [Pseudonocardiaceae bacterium]|nr:hypothetical protein [Pseudonocardiaceae bacterium]